MDLENIDVIAIGNGDISMGGYEPDDHIVRYVYLTTLSSEECARRMKDHNNTNSIICADPKDGACVGHGDSGNLVW